MRFDYKIDLPTKEETLVAFVKKQNYDYHYSMFLVEVKDIEFVLTEVNEKEGIFDENKFKGIYSIKNKKGQFKFETKEVVELLIEDEEGNEFKVLVREV